MVRGRWFRSLLAVFLGAGLIAPLLLSSGSSARQGWTLVELLRPGGVCASPNDDNGAYALHGWKLASGLSYNINTDSIPKDLKLTATAVVAAIDAGAAAWTGAGAPTLVNGGPTTKKAGFRDGVNAIDFGGGAYGAVAVAWILASEGIVQEVDMRFATSGFKWATNESATGDCGGAVDRFDITDVAVHEFGHWVGAAHTGTDALNNAQSMYPYVSYKELFKRTLGSGDQAAVAAIYPIP